jgi:hypothetical protein
LECKRRPDTKRPPEGGLISVRFPGNSERGLRLRDDGAERVGLMHGEIGQNLAVHLDPGLRQTVDEARIGQLSSWRAHGGVDPLDPQRAELALAALRSRVAYWFALSTACVAVRKLRARAP